MSKHRRQRPGRGQFTGRQRKARSGPGPLIMAVAALLLSAGCATVGFAALNQQHGRVRLAGLLSPAAPGELTVPHPRHILPGPESPFPGQNRSTVCRADGRKYTLPGGTRNRASGPGTSP